MISNELNPCITSVDIQASCLDDTMYRESKVNTCVLGHFPSVKARKYYILNILATVSGHILKKIGCRVQVRSPGAKKLTYQCFKTIIPSTIPRNI